MEALGGGRSVMGFGPVTDSRRSYVWATVAIWFRAPELKRQTLPGSESGGLAPRQALLLGRLEVRVGAGGVVSHVNDAVDLGDSVDDGDLDALGEGDRGHAAALASAAQP